MILIAEIPQRNDSNDIDKINDSVNADDDVSTFIYYYVKMFDHFYTYIRLLFLLTSNPSVN